MASLAIHVQGSHGALPILGYQWSHDVKYRAFIHGRDLFCQGRSTQHWYLLQDVTNL